MQETNSLKDISFYSPAIFTIAVKGLLQKGFSDSLCNLNIEHKKTNGGEISLLHGEVIDQTALMGILNSLYIMRFPIISVKLNNRSINV